jgi:hypothetical protein
MICGRKTGKALEETGRDSKIPIFFSRTEENLLDTSV